MNVYLCARLAPDLLRGWCGPVETVNPADPADPVSWLTGVSTGAVSCDGGVAEVYHVAEHGRSPDLTEKIRLDARRSEVAHRVVDWARTGLVCSACEGAGGLCSFCCGGGYRRARCNLWPFLPRALGGVLDVPPHVEREVSAALLVWSVERIAAGGAPVLDVATPWRAYTGGALARWSMTNQNLLSRAGLNHFFALGWECMFAPGSHGPEEGIEGRACADRALLGVDESCEYLREHRGLNVRKGSKVLVGDRPGVVLGGTGHVWVRHPGVKRPFIYHPAEVAVV